MTGWQKIAHGSVLDRFIILQKLQTKKFWYDFTLGSEDFVMVQKKTRFDVCSVYCCLLFTNRPVGVTIFGLNLQCLEMRNQ